MSQNNAGLANRKPLSPVLLGCILALFLMVWLIILRLSYPIYQSNQQTQPFAELQSLIPLFFILLACYGVFSFWALFTRDTGKYCSFAIVLVGALILWYTPYLMTGFVKQNDTIWHMGMAAYAPSILSGNIMPFSSYVNEFPLSYMLGFMAIETTGANIVFLANYIMPLFFAFVFTLFFYVLFMKYFDARTSSLGTLGAIVLLHFVTLHFSPQVVGLSLLFTGLLLFKNSRYAIVMLIGVLLLATHIVSFALFGFSIVIALIVNRYLSPEPSTTVVHSKRRAFLVIGILVVITFLALLNYLDFNVSKVLNSNLLSFLFTNSFEVPWFKLLATLIYLSASIVLLWMFLRIVKGKSVSLIRPGALFHKVEPSKLILALFAMMCLSFAIATATIEHSPVLIERGLFFFLPIGMAFMVWWTISTMKDGWRSFKILGIGFMVLMLLYPVCSYSIDSYNSFPESEGAGLRFLALRCDINHHSVDQAASGQIDAYLSPGMDVNMYNILSFQSDFILYRKSVDFKYRLHNPDSKYYYLELYNGLDQNNSFNRIYCNPNYMIYLQEGVIP